MVRILSLPDTLPVDATAPRHLIVTFPKRHVLECSRDEHDPVMQKRLALEMVVDLMAKHEIPREAIREVRIVSVPASTFERLCKADNFIAALGLVGFGGAE